MEYAHNKKTEEMMSNSASNLIVTDSSFTEQIQPPAFQLKTQTPDTPDSEELSKDNHSGNPEHLKSKKEHSNGFDEQSSPQKTSGFSGASFQLIEEDDKTGLPENLKSGIEHLSGFTMDDVQVNYNSDKPAQLNAHAYTQGSNIEIASGQEKHLPHEAWHVVQQKQGRVQPTKQMKGKAPINDDLGLELEADEMGAKALQTKTPKKADSNPPRSASEGRIIQREVIDNYSAAIKKPLTTAWYKDWAVTDRESLRVVTELTFLSSGDLIDTYNQMQKDGSWDVLYEQAPRDNKDWHDLRWKLTRLGQPVLHNGKEDKRLAKLHSALSASKRAVQGTMLLTTDSNVLAKMKEVEINLGLAASTLEKGMDLESGTKAIYKISVAASRLNNVREDRLAAAQEFGNLLSAVGDLGELLPLPGPLKGYFTFLGGSKNFFYKIAAKGDPRDRINTHNHPGLREAINLEN